MSKDAGEFPDEALLAGRLAPVALVPLLALVAGEAPMALGASAAGMSRGTCSSLFMRIPLNGCNGRSGWHTAWHGMGSTMVQEYPSLPMMCGTVCAMTFAFCRLTELVRTSAALPSLPMISRSRAGSTSLWAYWFIGAGNFTTMAISPYMASIDKCKLPLAREEWSHLRLAV